MKIGNEAFHKNHLEGDINLSPLVKVTEIGKDAFSINKLTGTLTLPPHIEVIGRRAFNKSPASKSDSTVGYNRLTGKLIIPESLKTIDDYAFYANRIEELDLSNAKNLTLIGRSSFRLNSLAPINFTKAVKLSEIRKEAFYLNRRYEGTTFSDGQIINVDTALPYSLKRIGYYAMETAKNITIRYSKLATGINSDSFWGNTDITLTNDVTP